MLAGDEVGKLTLAPCDVAWDQELAAPSVGVAALLNRLSTGVKSASLLDPAKLSLPMNSRHLVSMFAAACVAIMGGYSAIVDGSEWFKASEHVAQVADDCDEVQAQLDDLSGGAESGSVMNTSPQLAQALTMRRPLSRLIGEISNSVSAGVSLEEIKFASTSPIVVSGQVEGSSRQDALTAMGHFTKKVHALEFVMAKGHDEVSEVVGQLNRFRFTLTLAWRN